eukprot:6193273-Pleurochrysis_carterae.AAC.3
MEDEGNSRGGSGEEKSKWCIKTCDEERIELGVGQNTQGRCKSGEEVNKVVRVNAREKESGRGWEWGRNQRESV